MAGQQIAGQRIGRYELREALGVGGMAVVYRAHQADLKRQVALKVVSETLSQHPGYIERFIREAETAASLEHQHIVPVHDFGIDNGVPYIVMRLLEGGSLAERITHLMQGEGLQPSLGEITTLLQQLASALDYAHSRNILHRDVKPSNIMFDQQGSAYLLDFGIAKLLEETASLTGTGLSMGTPAYMSPEQWRAEELTAATDQYALGAITYALVTGHPPFEAPTPYAWMHKHLNEMPTPAHIRASHVPEALTPVLERAMAKDPAARFPTVTAFAQAFARAIAGQEGEPTDFFTKRLPKRPLQVPLHTPSGPSRPRTPVPPPAVPLGQRPIVWAAGAAALVVAMVGLLMAAGVLSGGSTGEETEPTPNAGAGAASSTPSPPVIETVAPKTPTDLPDTPTPQPSDTPLSATDLARTMDAEIAAVQTAHQQTVNALLSQTAAAWTETPSVTPTLTPDLGATARLLATQTQQVIDTQATHSAQTSTALYVATQTRQFLLTQTYAAQKATEARAGLEAMWGNQTATAAYRATQTQQARDDRATQTAWSQALTATAAAWAPTPSPTRTPTITPLPTWIRTATPTVTSSPTRTVTPNPTTTPVPIPLSQVDPAAITEVARLGKGVAVDVAWSPNGNTLAVASAIGVWLYRTDNPGDDGRLLGGHTHATLSVAWSPDGTQLASGSGDGTVRLWDAASGQELRVLEGHTNAVYSVTWSPDGTRLASRSTDDTVHVWDAASGHELHALEGHTDRVTSVAWSPDGTRLASGSGDGTVRLWDAASGQELRVLEGHTSTVNSVAWSPNGRWLASGSNDYTIRVWGIATGTTGWVLEGRAGWINSVAWSPDGTQIASGSDTVRLWDAASGQELRALEGHTGRVFDVAWSPDGTQLASASGDDTVRLWDAASGQELRALGGHTNPVLSVAWSPDGTRLASGSDDGTVRVWDVVSGHEMRVLEGHTNAVYSVAWSPDGTQLASGSVDGTVRTWDTASGREVRVLEGHTGLVFSVAWSPDGKQLASGITDGTVRLWDAASGQELRALGGHTNPVLSVAWSPDGTRLASGSEDGTMRLWDVVSGQELRVLEGHTNAVYSVAWSPDGTQLASGSDDGMVRLWDAVSGQELRVLEGHTDYVLSVAWSPDGKQLASGSGDGTVRLWDAASGQELRVLEGHTNPVLSVAWSPDGTRLASGSDDGTVRVWGVAESASSVRTVAPIELSETFQTPSGITFRHPAGWIVLDEYGEIIFATSEDAMQAWSDGDLLPSGEVFGVFLYPETVLEELQAKSFDALSPASVLQAFIQEMGGWLTFGNVGEFHVGSRPGAVSYITRDRTGDGLVVAYDVGDGAIIVALAVTAPGEFLQFEPLVMEIFKSVTYTPPQATEAAEEIEAPELIDCEAYDLSDMQIGLVTDVGRIADKSFNQSSWEGVLAASLCGAEVDYIETVDAADYADNIAEFAEGGYNVIVTVGFALGPATLEAAAAYPDVTFIGVDQFQAEPVENVVGLVFNEDQSGFLAGVLAARLSETGTIAAVLGTDQVPPVVAFNEGYQAGARYINPDINIISTYHPGGIDQAFTDPEWGATTARQALDQNADVIFGAGGKTGNGALIEVANAVGEEGPPPFCIGVDTDQWLTVPEAHACLVSSAIKLLDKGVADIIMSIADDAFVPGNFFGSPALAPFHDFEPRLPARLRAELFQISQGLADGSITVGYGIQHNTTRGEILFTQNCAGCHGEQDGAGPALPGIGKQAATRVEGMSAEDYLHESIVNPSAYIVDGYHDIMPKSYGEEFSGEESANLVAYIMHVTATTDKTVAAANDLSVVTVGMNAEYPPFEFVDEDGNVAGFDVDLMNAIADEAGFDLEFVNTRWDGIFVALQSGEFDAVASAATITEEREEIVDFSNPYFNAGQMIAVREADAADISTPDDLAGLRVGVQSGTTGDIWASENIPGVEMVRYDEVTLAFQALAAGDIDAVFNDGPVSAEIITQNPEMGVMLVGEPATDEFYGVAVQPDLPELLDAVNEGLQAIIDNGTYRDIFMEWFGIEPPGRFQPAEGVIRERTRESACHSRASTVFYSGPGEQYPAIIFSNAYTAIISNLDPSARTPDNEWIKFALEDTEVGIFGWVQQADLQCAESDLEHLPIDSDLPSLMAFGEGSDPASSPLNVTWSPDGRYLASPIGDTVTIWNTATGEVVHTLQGHWSGVIGIAWSPDGTRLASFGSDDTIRIWDASSGEELRWLELWGVRDVAWSPDGIRLAGVSYQKTIQLWDATTGEALHTLGGQKDDFWFTSVAWSPIGTRLVVGTSDGAFQVWDTVNGQRLHVFDGHMYGIDNVAWSPDGERVASIGLGFSLADNDQLVLTSDKVLIWDIHTFQTLQLDGAIDNLRSMTWSPDGAWLATSSSDGIVRIWDRTTGKQLYTLDGQITYVGSVAWSPDGKYLALGGEKVIIWPIPQRVVHTLPDLARPLPICIVFPTANVNVRAEPGPDAARVAVAIQGQRMDVLAQEAGNDNELWYNIQVAGENAIVTGWVRADLVVAAGDGCPALE